MKKLFYLLFILMLLPINTKAVYEVIDSRCTTELKLSLKEEGKNITYRLSNVTDNNNVTYTLYFYNLTENIYLTDSNGNIINSDKIENLKPGTKISLNLYASNKNYCEGYKVATKLISVPYYNPYAKSDLCNGYEEYYLCSEDTNVTLSQEEFEKKLEEYKKSLKETEEEKPIEIEEDKFNLLEFIQDYWYYFASIIGIIFIVVITIIIINKRKNRGIL